MLGQIRSVKFS